MSYPKEQGASPIHLAAELGNLNALASLIALNPSELESLDADKATPLHYAAAAGQIDAVRLLLEKGASPFARDEAGLTPRNSARTAGSQGLRIQEILKAEERRQRAKERNRS